MDERVVREFRERYQAVAIIEAQEQKASTIDLRWQQLNALLRLAMGLGLSLAETDNSVELIRQRWAKLKAART
jgi:hypothetical protein